MAGEGVWELVALENVVVPTERRDPTKTPNDPFVYVDIGSVDSTTGAIVNPRELQGREAPSRARKVILSGDVIFATTRPYLRNIALVPNRYHAQICSTGFCVLRADREALDPSFLYYLCRSDVVLEQVLPRMRGASYPAVTDLDILTCKVPLPPLDEQRRIVARIEALFERIEEARWLRVAGDAEADMIFASVSGDVFESLCEDGQPAFRLEELVGDSRNGLYKPQSFYGSGTPIVRIDSFEVGRIRGFDKLKRLQLSQDELDKYSLKVGDILVNRVNGSLDELGKSAAVHILPEPTVFESNIMRFRVDGDRVLPEFVVAFLHSQQGRGQIQTKARAIQQFSINQRDVGSIVVPTPPLPEQRRIVEYLDGVQAQVDELRRLQTASAAELERLKGAVLARAFKGEL